MDVVRNNKVMFLDEVETSLHTTCGIPVICSTQVNQRSWYSLPTTHIFLT